MTGQYRNCYEQKNPLVPLKDELGTSVLFYFPFLLRHLSCCFFKRNYINKYIIQNEFLRFNPCHL